VSLVEQRPLQVKDRVVDLPVAAATQSEQPDTAAPETPSTDVDTADQLNRVTVALERVREVIREAAGRNQFNLIAGLIDERSAGAPNSGSHVVDAAAWSEPSTGILGVLGADGQPPLSSVV
jgi:hypothetical protein